MNNYPRTSHTLRLKETRRRVPARRDEAGLAGSLDMAGQATPSTAPVQPSAVAVVNRAAVYSQASEPASRQLTAQAPAVQAGATTPKGAPEGSLRSEALLAGKRLVQILHNGSVYELRATRLGKLILTK
ncbi:MAG: hemin uptake protein HemP [Janthinobacterium lividum]